MYTVFEVCCEMLRWHCWIAKMQHGLPMLKQPTLKLLDHAAWILLSCTLTGSVLPATMETKCCGIFFLAICPGGTADALYSDVCFGPIVVVEQPASVESVLVGGCSQGVLCSQPSQATVLQRCKAYHGRRAVCWARKPATRQCLTLLLLFISSGMAVTVVRVLKTKAVM